jgi:S-adenosylmethionine:tRNA ribosyltransferase-isomerase
MRAVHISEFDYELPEELIAQYPLEPRSASRLLTLDGASGALADRKFNELPDLLDAGDLLIGNNTRVIRARLVGRKDSGGRIEVLLERLLDESRALAQVRASKPPRIGMRLHIEPEGELRVLSRQEEFFELEAIAPTTLSALMARAGHVPLPPYIRRADEAQDNERYQTIYSRHQGAVAAPTAGLHFDQPLLDRLAERGIEMDYITLHVGAATFQPLRVQEIEFHQMHAEHIEVSARLCKKIIAVKARGSRVVSVGTTVMRALESAAAGGRLAQLSGETRIFIYPGYRFCVADHLITNFHLPQSTLLLLVCAFAGRDRVLGAYQHAVEQGYRFYSYGDAMLVKADPSVMASE